MDTILNIKNLKKNYHTLEGEVEAVGDFSLTVRKGEFVIIVGPSGCGKSTILSILCGLEQNQKGVSSIILIIHQLLVICYNKILFSLANNFKQLSIRIRNY